MKLFEQYETLRRRGMPGLPRLILRFSVNESGGRIYKCFHWPVLGSNVGLPCHPDDARDLITMHAIKWVESMGDGRAAVFHREGGKWSLTLHHDDTHCSVTVPPLLGLVALDAIIAATEHLEPKETP